MPFQPRTLSNGRICCSRPDVLCDACRAYHDGSADDDPPNPYTKALRALAVSAQQPQPTPAQALDAFKERYAEGRVTELFELAAELEADVAAHPFPRFIQLTAAEEAEIPDPPNGYTVALAAMKETR